MKIVITGMGAVTPLGIGVDKTWNALCAGKDGIRQISVCDLSDFSFQQGGEISDLNLDDRLSEYVPENDRASQLMIVATQEALESVKQVPDNNTAVVLATNFANIGTAENELGTENSVITGELGFHSTVDYVADIWKCTGPTVSLSLSCSSGSAAIGYGTELIKNGYADRVIAGGYDSISRFAWSGLSVLRTMTEEKIRPFDKNRSGTLFSEGSGAVILETYDHAVKHGADIFAELCGFGFNNNAFHMTAPAKEGAGLSAAMKAALRDADIAADSIDHINTHGTGTRFNDITETQAIKSALGPHAKKVPITSIKSMTGHLMGAAGIVEAIASIKSLIDNKIPPTINVTEQDPECDLPLVTGNVHEQPLTTVISNSSGIGGNNVSLVFKKAEVDR